MGNIELNRIEIETLKQLIRFRYGIPLMEANNNANYRALCEQINRVGTNNQVPVPFQNYTVSEDQLRRLFWLKDESVSYRRYFIQFCYFYACGQFREAYLEAHPIDNQSIMFAKMNQEKNDLKQTEIKIDHAERQDSDLIQPEIKVVALDQQIEVLKNSLKQNLAKIADLEHSLKQNLDKAINLKQKNIEHEQEKQRTEKKKRLFQKIAFLMTILLVGLGNYFWHWKERRHEELVWLNAYNMTDSAEAAFLKSRLPFMNDSTSDFRKIIHNWTVLLMEGYKKLDTMKTPLPVILEEDRRLIHYTVYPKCKPYCDKIEETYCAEKVTWQDSNDTIHKKIAGILGIDDSVQILFEKYTDAIVLKYKQQPDKRSEDFFENLFGVKKTGAYLPIFMFAVFKKEHHGINQSREILVRYPPYDLTQKFYKNRTYILQGRPWWQDVMNQVRTKAFSWTEIIDNEVVTMGLSRAYSSARYDHRMMQRAFWVDIPLKKEHSKQVNEKLLLCVDFTLKTD
jgi:hypothetical protein